MIEHRRVATTYEVWKAIRAAHPELVVFSSYSNPTGDDGIGGGPEMMTEYGFRGGDAPIMGARTTWEHGFEAHDRINEQHEYWLCSPMETDE